MMLKALALKVICYLNFKEALDRNVPIGEDARSVLRGVRIGDFRPDCGDLRPETGGDCRPDPDGDLRPEADPDEGRP